MDVPFAFDLDGFLDRALAEDIGTGDVTSRAIVPEGTPAAAELRVREDGVVSGLDVALAVFRRVDAAARLEPAVTEGEAVEGGATLARVACDARALLAGERLALNLLGRLMGIATATRRYVEAVAGTGVDVVCTRKTTPLLRALEKRAVVAGGGKNHRFGLFDAVLVKDNHLELLGAARTPARIEEVTRRARAGSPPGTFVQIEVETEEEALAALAGGADGILFDNFRPGDLAGVVAAVRRAADRRVLLEASGGITLENVREYAETGVDRVSVGALTHSVRSLDVALDLVAPDDGLSSGGGDA